jgi:NADP-dependent 3-hydroxy acid dehydrogenase YdfG
MHEHKRLGRTALVACHASPYKNDAAGTLRTPKLSGQVRHAWRDGRDTTTVGNRVGSPVGGTIHTMSDHVRGKVVIVTGAASGFGRLVAEKVGARGARVVVADIDAAGAESVAAAIRAAGGEAIHRGTDVTDREDTPSSPPWPSTPTLPSTCSSTMRESCRSPSSPITAAAAEAWDRCIDVNLKGVLHGITAVYDQMIAQGHGHVVNISSIYGNVPVVGSAVYSATKAAVNVISESLRAESQGRIKVTVVRPTGVPGTGLGASIVNGEALVGLVGQNMELFRQRATAVFGAGPTGAKAEFTDPEKITTGPSALTSWRRRSSTSSTSRGASRSATSRFEPRASSTCSEPDRLHARHRALTGYSFTYTQSKEGRRCRSACTYRASPGREGRRTSGTIWRGSRPRPRSRAFRQVERDGPRVADQQRRTTRARDAGGLHGAGVPRRAHRTHRTPGLGHGRRLPRPRLAGQSRDDPGRALGRPGLARDRRGVERGRVARPGPVLSAAGRALRASRRSPADLPADVERERGPL